MHGSARVGAGKRCSAKSATIRTRDADHDAGDGQPVAVLVGPLDLVQRDVPSTMAAIEPTQQRKPVNEEISEAIASPFIPG